MYACLIFIFDNNFNKNHYHHHHHRSLGAQCRGRPTPASPSSARCFGPMLSGSLLADLLRTTPRYRLPMHILLFKQTFRLFLFILQKSYFSFDTRAVIFYQLQFEIAYDDACRFSRRILCWSFSGCN